MKTMQEEIDLKVKELGLNNTLLILMIAYINALEIPHFPYTLSHPFFSNLILDDYLLDNCGLNFFDFSNPDLKS